MSFSPHLRSLEISQGWGLQGQNIFGFQDPCQFEWKVQSLNRISGGKVSKKGPSGPLREVVFFLRKYFFILTCPMGKGPGIAFAN